MAKLYFYYSTMNAGKSTALLQAAHNYAERGMATRLFTARIDDRADGRIASRIGIGAEAERFDDATDFWQACRPAAPSSSRRSDGGSAKPPPTPRMLVTRRRPARAPASVTRCRVRCSWMTGSGW